MNRLAPLLSALILTAACEPDTGLQAIPNRAPVAVAFVFEGPDIDSTKRLGYVVEGEAATLDGSQSFDEDARGDMAFAWTLLSVPEGSALQVLDVPEEDPETDIFEAAFPTFLPDMLGTYRIELVVSDTREGVSNPAIVNIQVVPPSQLSVTLEWDVSGVDLDLHVVREGGSYFDLAGESDCFSWTPNPDWGDSTSAEDNPQLDRDLDGERQGPFREVVTLPEPGDGTYRIYVHYYADHVAIDGGNNQVADAQIDVKVLGRSIAETITSPTPIQVGQVWEVRDLDWPSQALNTLGGAYTTHSALGGPEYNNQP